MISSRPPKKPDLFNVLMLVVALGMTATLAFQAKLYFDQDSVSVNRQAQNLQPTSGG